VRAGAGRGGYRRVVRRAGVVRRLWDWHARHGHADGHVGVFRSLRSRRGLVCARRGRGNRRRIALGRSRVRWAERDLRAGERRAVDPLALHLLPAKEVDGQEWVEPPGRVRGLAPPPALALRATADGRAAVRVRAGRCLDRGSAGGRRAGGEELLLVEVEAREAARAARALLRGRRRGALVPKVA
jgi:hypothetical protein